MCVWAVYKVFPQYDNHKLKQVLHSVSLLISVIAISVIVVQVNTETWQTIAKATFSSGFWEHLSGTLRETKCFRIKLGWATEQHF